MEAAGSGSFKRGEKLLLRTAMSREDLQVTLTVRFNPIKTKEEKTKKEEEGVKRHRKNGIVDENSHVNANDEKAKNESVTTIVDKGDNGAVLVDDDNDKAGGKNDGNEKGKKIITESGAPGLPGAANQAEHQRPRMVSDPAHAFGLHDNDEEAKDLEIEDSDEDDYGEDDDEGDDDVDGEAEDELDDYGEEDDDEDQDEDGDDDIKTQTKLVAPKHRLLNQDMSNNMPM